MVDKIWTPSEMGRKGGKISKRVLTPEQAKKMVEAREKKKADKLLKKSKNEKAQ